MQKETRFRLLVDAYASSFSDGRRARRVHFDQVRLRYRLERLWSNMEEEEEGQKGEGKTRVATNPQLERGIEGTEGKRKVAEPTS